MNHLLACERRVHGMIDGDVIGLHCRDCSRIQRGRTLRLQVFHRWRIVGGVLMPLEDLFVLPDTPFDGISLLDS